MFMEQVLTGDAKARLSNIAVVKPEKAERIENIIIQNVQTGKVNGKITDGMILDLLN